MCPHINKKLAIKTISGYKQADSFIEGEKRANLSRLSKPAGRRIFEELWATWKQSSSYDTGEALDRLKIDSLIRRRHAIDKLSAAKSRT